MYDAYVDETAGLMRSMIAAAPGDLDAAALAAFGRLGFAGATLVRLSERCGALDPHRVSGTPFPPDWQANYARRGYARHDPFVAMALRASSPFTWSEAEARFCSVKSRMFVREARRHLWPEVLVCPTPGRDGDLVVVVLGLTARRDIPIAERVLAQAVACLYAALAQAAVVDVEDEPAERPVLSRRELQCVYWVFQGRTDQEIAEILDISASTVHHHVEKAKSRLKARSRVDLARRAVQQGIVVEPRLLN